jgi:hypothetical protein
MSERRLPYSTEEQFVRECKSFLLRIDFTNDGIIEDVTNQMISLLSGSQPNDPNLLIIKPSFGQHGIPQLDAVQVIQHYQNSQQLKERVIGALMAMFVAYLSPSCTSFLRYIATEKEKEYQAVSYARRDVLVSEISLDIAVYLTDVALEKLKAVVGANDHPEAADN